VARLVQSHKSFNRIVVDAFAALLVDVFFEITWQGCDDFDFALCHELDEILVTLLQQYRQVASIKNVQMAHPRKLIDQAAEVWIHFRSAAGDVDDFDAEQITIAIEPAEDTFHRLPRHDLRPIRARLDMTMVTREIAEFPDVKLQRSNRATQQCLPVPHQTCRKKIDRFSNRQRDG